LNLGSEIESYHCRHARFLIERMILFIQLLSQCTLDIGLSLLTLVWCTVRGVAQFFFPCWRVTYVQSSKNATKVIGNAQCEVQFHYKNICVRV
jgi:hypothetical protein